MALASRASHNFHDCSGMSSFHLIITYESAFFPCSRPPTRGTLRAASTWEGVPWSVLSCDSLGHRPSSCREEDVLRLG